MTIEMFIGFILNYIPYFSFVRLGFFIYLMLPQTDGAMLIYTKVLQPYLKKHQKEIDDFIAKVSSQASDYQKDITSHV